MDYGKTSPRQQAMYFLRYAVNCTKGFTENRKLLLKINIDSFQRKAMLSGSFRKPREGQLQTFCKIDLQLLHTLIIIIDR